MLERVFIRAVSMLTADSVSPLLSLEPEQSLARSGNLILLLLGLP